MHVGLPNMKYFMLVSIAGSVPRYIPTGAVSEIRLGDVVVSFPRAIMSGYSNTQTQCIITAYGPGVTIFHRHSNVRSSSLEHEDVL
jgi:hypothetical protein